MCKKILFVSLLLFQLKPAHAMQSLSVIPMNVMQSILTYAMWVEAKDLTGWKYGQPIPERSNDAWHTIRRNYTLQLVSKDFRRIFWNCFTPQDKDSVIWQLLYFKKKNSMSLIDLAMNVQARLYPLLKHAIRTKYNPECVRAILAIGNAKVINKIDDSGHFPMTPLYLAIEAGNCDITQLLLSCPVTDVNTTVPLYMAVIKEDIEIVKLLLAHPKIQVNAVNEDGETALFAVAVSPAYELRFAKNALYCIIELLIKAGIDSSIKNNNGDTALDVARKSEVKIFEVLEQALAKKNNS